MTYYSERDHRGNVLVRLVLGLPRALVLGAFLLLLIASPLPMGGNRDWAWAPMSIAMGLIAVACVLVTPRSEGWRVPADERAPLTFLIACFVAMVAVALLQMTPLSASGAAAAFYVKAADVLGRAHAAVASVAVDASRNTLLKCVTCGLIFLTARALFHDTRRARLLLWALVASGTLVTAYAILIQSSTGFCYVGSFLRKQTDYNLHDRCLMSGTFVGSNNFGAFCGMALAAAVALMFVDRRRRRQDFEESEPEGAVAQFVTWLTGTRLVLAALSFLFLGCLMISGSRAGFLVTAFGVAALVVLMLRERLKSRRTFAATLAASLAIAVAIGLLAGGPLIRKLSTLEQADTYNRLVIWQAAGHAIADSPWWGWGLGSFADVYAVYQPKEIVQPNDKAHSTPIEAMVELGIPGGLVACLVVLVPWWICLRGAWRRRRHRYLPASAFAVSGVAILHSTVDFSLQMPAIGFIVSALLGMGWAQTFPRGDATSGTFTVGDG